jgi:AraC-like DNA-binding protein
MTYFLHNTLILYFFSLHIDVLLVSLAPFKSMENPMNNRASKLAKLAGLVEKHTPENGPHQTILPSLLTFRETESHGRMPLVYEPALVIAANGEKHLFLDGKRFVYSAGHLLALFMPMAVECELIGVSEENPMLGIGIRLDRQRLAQLVMKMDSVEDVPKAPEVVNTSGIFSAPMRDKLLDASIRLLQSLEDPVEAAVIGETIIDEIYFRVLAEEQGGALKTLLRQHGQIQQISRAVEHLSENLKENVSVENLARMVNMSNSGFHRKFREVMHVSPLQYTKLIRLNKARSYIMEGRKASEAGYKVGYNSPAQFSREYKRQFGVSPSASR